MATSRSKLAKGTRKLEMEKLIVSSAYEKDANLGASELAKELEVTPRTVRNYLAERREELFGPQRIWLHLYSDEQHTQKDRQTRAFDNRGVCQKSEHFRARITPADLGRATGSNR